MKSEATPPPASKDCCNASGNRAISVVASANGIKTRYKVRSFTSRANRGLQNTTVPYQFPSAVVGSATVGITGSLTLSNSLFVACRHRLQSSDRLAPLPPAKG